MSGTFVKRLLPFAILILLSVLFWPGLTTEAALALGITPTPTPTVTPTPLPTPTPTPQVGVADPAITKRGEPSKALPGEDVTFTLKVTNQGQQAAVGVVVTDEVPEYLEIIKVTTTQGAVTIEGQTVTVDIGVVGPGFVVEIVIHTRVRENTPAPMDMENVALLTLPNSGDRTSPPVVVTVPGPLLPPTGRPAISWPACVLLGIGLATLGAWLGKRKQARGEHRANSRR